MGWLERVAEEGAAEALGRLEVATEDEVMVKVTALVEGVPALVEGVMALVEDQLVVGKKVSLITQIPGRCGSRPFLRRGQPHAPGTKGWRTQLVVPTRQHWRRRINTKSNFI